MKNNQDWEVSVKLNKNGCPYIRHHTGLKSTCGLPGHWNSTCTYENCPKRVPRTCKDCRYLYYNQNPSEPLKGKLTSFCGMKRDRTGHMEEIHTAEKLERDHYKIPNWCPKNWDTSTIETFTAVEG